MLLSECITSHVFAVVSLAAGSAAADALLFLLTARTPVQFRTLSPKNTICSVSTTCSRDGIPLK